MALAPRGLLAFVVGCGGDPVPMEGGSTGEDGTGSSTSSDTPTVTASSGSSGEPESTSGEESSGESMSSPSSSSSSSETSSESGPVVDPEANDDLFRTPSDETLVVGAADGLFANDVDAGVLTLVETDPTTERGGTIDVAPDGSFTYEPPAGDWGPDSFAYTVMNDTGGTASAVARINITPVEIPLSEISDGHNGFSIDGGAADWLTGYELAGAGDVDGDGIGDLVLSSPWWGANFEGRTHIVFGKDDLDTVDLGDVANGTGGILIQGAAYDQSGLSIGSGGDVNGDGLADVVIGGGNPFGESPAQVDGWLVFGKASTDPITLNVLAADGDGFMLTGEATSTLGEGGEYPTMRVDIVGDMNDDGLDEILVGFREVPDTGALRCWIVFGKNDTDPIDLALVTSGEGGFPIDGTTGGTEWAPRWVASAGDVNGDGRGDVLIAAPTAAADGRDYVVFGKSDTDPVDLATLAADGGGFVIAGSSSASTGWTASGAGDVDGDGLDDVIVSAYPGIAVVFGKADTEVVSLADVVAGEGGFSITDLDVYVVGGGGDVNGDGLADIVAGLPNEITPAGYGRAYVVYGKADGLAITAAELLDGSLGFALDADPISNNTAETVEIVEMSGDALADVIVGAYNTPVGGTDFLGRTYVARGTSTAPY